MAIRMFGANHNNDMYLGPDGNIAIHSGLLAVEQACEHTMKTMLQEMVLAYDKGLPNFQTVWVGSPNVPQFEAAGRAALQLVDGVVEVVTFDSIVSQNKLVYTAQIMTIYGDVYLNGQL
jgi:hypothetical protein